MKSYLILAAAVLAACSNQKQESTSAVRSDESAPASAKYECRWDSEFQWQTSDDLNDHVTGSLEVDIDSTDILSTLQMDQIVAAGRHLGYIESNRLSDLMETIDENRLSFVTVVQDGKTYDWIIMYSGDTQVGVVFEHGTFVIAAEIGDGDVMACVAVPADGSKIGFDDMMQPLFAPGSLKADLSYYFLGKKDGKTCAVTASAEWLQNSQKYFGMTFFASSGDEQSYRNIMTFRRPDALFDVLASTPTRKAYFTKQSGCSSELTVDMTFAGGESLANLKSLQSTILDNNCQDDAPRVASCEDLTLVLVQKPAMVKKLTTLAKAALPESANVITNTRNFGCSMDLSQNGGQVVCGWDISDDFGGDTGNVALFSYEVKDGEPTKIAKIRYEDKYTGEISDTP